MSISRTSNQKKQNQKKSHNIDHHYQTIFDSVGDAIFIHDMTGQLLEVNQRACDQLGYRREALLQLNLKDIDSPKNRDRIAPRIELLQQKERLFFETEHLRQDGQLVPVEITSRLIEYEEEPAILSIAR